MPSVTASGREGVGRLAGDQVDPRHRDAGAGGEAVDDRVEPRGRGLFDGLSAVGGEHHLVGEPVAEEVHQQGDHEGDQHALPAPEGPAEEDEHHREDGEEEARLEYV